MLRKAHHGGRIGVLPSTNFFCTKLWGYDNNPWSNKQFFYQDSKDYTPWNYYSTEKWWFPIGISFSKGLFSGAMLVSGRVCGKELLKLFRWISVASKFHIFFWESPDHMLNPWGSLSGHIHKCQLLWFLQNIQDDSSRDLFIPYLEVTKTAFWFRVTNFQHPKKGHQPAALPGRFV